MSQFLQQSCHSRRHFLQGLGMGGAWLASEAFIRAAAISKFQFRFMLASSMYGRLTLSEILPEVKKVGASHIDIWPAVHGNQREQVEAMGHDAFAAMLQRNALRLGCLTRYDLGPFGLDSEFSIAERFQCPVIVCGGKGPAGLKGAELKAAVGRFCQQLNAPLEKAAEKGVTIAIENHSSNLINTPDSLKWLIELRPRTNLKVALAPYHLESLGTDANELGELIRSLGNEIAVFYAWQHGKGCHTKLPKEEELLQMPGRGPFDFLPAVRALRDSAFTGFTEIFMHPVPRGIPILPTASETSAEINRGRAYLERLLTRL